MASAKYEHRQAAIRQTWGRDVAPGSLVFVDRNERPASLLARAAQDSFYAAQRRQFAGMTSAGFDDNQRDHGRLSHPALAAADATAALAVAR